MEGDRETGQPVHPRMTGVLDLENSRRNVPSCDSRDDKVLGRTLLSTQGKQATVDEHLGTS